MVKSHLICDLAFIDAKIYINKTARKLNVKWKSPLPNNFYAHTSMHIYTYTINRKLKVTFQTFQQKDSMEN